MAELLSIKTGLCRIVTLHRPKSLNALTLTMCQQMNNIFANMELGNTALLILKGSDKKAFCAGGDVKSLYNSVISADDENRKNVIGTGKPGHVSTDFFREEYIMNYKIATSKIPQISIWNGIVMGGGVGISIHGN